MTRPGHDGIPPQGPEFAEYLRRALHAAADQVEPRPDGLERIRARVQAGPAYASKHAKAGAFGVFLAELTRRWNAVRGGAGEHGRSGAGEPGHAGAGTPGRGGPGRSGPGPGGAQPWKGKYGLLRPVVAVACAVFAIGIAMAFPPLRDTLSQLSATVAGISTSSGSGGGQGSAVGGTTIGTTGGAGSQTGSSAGAAGGTGATCSASPSPTTTVKPTGTSPRVTSGGSAPHSTPASGSTSSAGGAASPSDTATSAGTPPTSTSPNATATKPANSITAATASTGATNSGKGNQASANPCRSTAPTTSPTTKPQSQPTQGGSTPPSTPPPPPSTPAQGVSPTSTGISSPAANTGVVGGSTTGTGAAGTAGTAGTSLP